MILFSLGSLELNRSKPHSDPLRIFVSVVEQSLVDAAETALEIVEQALDDGGIRTSDTVDTASTLLGNLKGLSEILKSVLDIVVEKIDEVAKVS